MRICRAKLASLVGADTDHDDIWMQRVYIEGCPSIYDYQSAALVAWHTNKMWAHDGFAQFASESSNSSLRQSVKVGHGIPDRINAGSFQKASV